MNERRAWGWIAGVTYVAAMLCAIGLGRSALWIDEIHSFEFSSLPSAWLVVLNAAVRDAYPPLYFLLLHAWMALGSDEIWLRMLSVVLHLASIPLTYLVARRLLPGAGAVVAAVLLAVAPIHLAYARETRMYALVAFLSLLSSWGLLAWIQDRSRAGFRVMTAAGIALLYTHFMGALFLLAQAAFFWRTDRLRRPVAGVTPFRWAALVVTAFLPWSPLFLKAVVVTRGYGAEATLLDQAAGFFGALGVGFGQPWPVFLAGGAVALVLALAGGSVLACDERRTWLHLWAFLPLLLELLAGLLGKPVFNERTLMCATPAWAILTAAALTGLPRWRRRGAVLAAASLAALHFANLFSAVEPASPRHGQALADVLAQLKPGDVIVHSSTATYHPVHLYYLPRSGAAVQDYLLEPEPEFHGGRLGEWIRGVWRDHRSLVDPAGSIQSGADPNRVADADFLKLPWKRVWYFRTDADGQRRLWMLQPSVYYFASAAKFPVLSLMDHPRIRARLKKRGETAYPGLTVELYDRLGGSKK